MSLPADETPDVARLAAAAFVEAQVAHANDDRDGCEDLLHRVLTHDVPEYTARALIELALIRESDGQGETAVEYLRAAEREARQLRSCSLLLDVAAGYLKMGHPLCSKRMSSTALDLAQSRREHLRGEPDLAEEDAQLRYCMALAYAQMAAAARRQNPPEDVLPYWDSAEKLNDPVISPFAAIERAVLAAESLQDPGGLLRTAMNYHHPVASTEATFEFAALQAFYGQVAPVRRLLDRIIDTAGDEEWRNRAKEALRDLPAVPKSRIADALRGARGDLLELDRGPGPSRRVLIVGAGMGGQQLEDALERGDSGLGRTEVIGFIDDNLDAHPGRSDILGTTNKLRQVIEEQRPHEVVMAFPTAPPSVKAKVAWACADRYTPLRTLPVMHEVARPADLVDQLRAIRIDDLLGDDPVVIDEGASGWLRNERVLIVGAGALGRQLAICCARAGAEDIALVDRDDIPLRRCVKELHIKFGHPSVEGRKGSSVDAEFLFRIAEEHRCSVMLHTTSTSWSSAAGGAENSAAADPARVRGVIDGVARLADALGDLRSLRRFGWISDANLGPTSSARALSAVAEAIALSPTPNSSGSCRRFAVRVPPLFTARSGVIEELRVDAKDRHPLRVPPSSVRARFMHAYVAAEQVLRACRSADAYCTYRVVGAQEVTLYEVANMLLRLENRTAGAKVPIDEDELMLVDDAPIPGGRPAVESLGRLHAAPGLRDELRRLRSAPPDLLIDFARRLVAQRAASEPPIEV